MQTRMGVAAVSVYPSFISVDAYSLVVSRYLKAWYNCRRTICHITSASKALSLGRRQHPHRKTLSFDHHRELAIYPIHGSMKPSAAGSEASAWPNCSECTSRRTPVK